MPRISLVEEAHRSIAGHLPSGGLAIDATAGNGHDTLFLAQHTGASGHVYSFDIQAEAIRATRALLQRSGLLKCVSLFQAGHEALLEHLPERVIGKIAAATFNLGYLPGADKTLITRTATTLPALSATCQVLAPGGCMTIMVYPGHPGGDREAAAVERWCRQLDSQWYALRKITLQHCKRQPPQLLVINKKQPRIR